MTMRRFPSAIVRMRGFSLVTGIFLLVVLSALGAFMVVFTGLQQNTVQNDVLGVRAYYAARAGINWALYRALDPENSIAPGQAVFAPCPAGTINTTAMGGSLAPFSVTVTCTDTSATEANRSIRVYEITATACNQAACVAFPAVPPTGYVERRVVVTVAKCKDQDPAAVAPYRCGI
jgi:MSHA biogenesis protein MshP